MDRIILHSDMNNFYASVECMLDPSLRDKPVAVCGNRADRHGIVLAKNNLAKACGVTTGEVIWQAESKCPGLVIVPPDFDKYLRFSRAAREIYARYTDLIEPFGMDECWLDVSGCLGDFADGYALADDIRRAIKYELGVTVSVGVSFNKIFAKLGSDMKKPDAVTCIPRSDYKHIVWRFPAGDMLGVGPATYRVLAKYGIHTIGDIANSDPDFLRLVLKSHGTTIWQFANGMDNSAVSHMDYSAPIKSVGHGITTSRDMCGNDDVACVILELVQDVGRKLRRNVLSAGGVSVTIRDKDLHYKEWQTRLPMYTNSDTDIARCAISLLREKYDWSADLRSVTVRAIDLVPSDQPVQFDIFNERSRILKREKVDKVKDEIRARFGNNAIMSAAMLGNSFLAVGEPNKVRMPTGLVTCKQE